MATLTISFIPTSTGSTYRLRYRAAGAPTYIIAPESATSPITITGLDISLGYEGLLDSNCGVVGYSTPALFSIAPGGGGGCFVAGTVITLADDTVTPIELIEAGDQVLAFDDNHNLYPATVTDTLVKYNEVVILQAGTYQVKTTAEHPFLTADGFKTIAELVVGDCIYVLEDQTLVLQTIYNIQHNI